MGPNSYSFIIFLFHYYHSGQSKYFLKNVIFCKAFFIYVILLQMNEVGIIIIPIL